MKAAALFSAFLLCGSPVMARAGAPDVTTVATPGALALARKIVTQLHAERQLTFALGKLGPLFGTQVVAAVNRAPADQNPFRDYLSAPGGQEHVMTILNDAYVTAFKAHLPEFLETMARGYATSLSQADLNALSAFLETPAGVRWADATVEIQAAASAEGNRIGTLAGSEAVAGALKTLSSNGAAK